jgi:hypothetical protein
MRAVVAAAAVGVLSLVTAASAHAAPAELTGKVTFTTSSAASALVHIANPTATFPDENAQGGIRFLFRGDPLLRGLVLLGETPDASGKRYVAYVDGSVGEEGESSFPPGPIPAGDYRLYAFSDGRPTQFTITMPTGRGDSVLTLTDPVAADIHRMKFGGGGGVFRGSAATTGPGTVFATAATIFGAAQGGTVEFCDAIGPTADTDAPYTLGCSQGGMDVVLGGSDFGSVIASTRFDTSGGERRGFGGNVQSIGAPTLDGGLAAITFTPSGAPGPAAPIEQVGAVAARVVSTSVRTTKKGRAPISVRCAGPGSCRVRLTLTGSSSKGKASIAAGATTKVNVRLSSSLRKKLKRKRSMKVTLVLQVTGESGTGTTVTRKRITLRAPKR